MAELTNLEEKLGEVTGLAMAAQAATAERSKKWRSMRTVAWWGAPADARRGRGDRGALQRARRLFEGKKTAILEEAREVEERRRGDDVDVPRRRSDALDGFEFLTMAEAGRGRSLGRARELNERAGNAEITELIDWALPIQERHFQAALARLRSSPRRKTRTRPRRWLRLQVHDREAVLAGSRAAISER